MLIATPIYRRNWHIISVLTSSQQQTRSPCSAWVDNEENISTTECSVAFMNTILPQQNKSKILGYKDTLFRL